MKKTVLSIFTAIVFALIFENSLLAADDLRISGKSRYDTAVEISKEAFDKADTVVLSTAYNFPDALAGGPLAFLEDAPILLTSKDSLGNATKEEIIRLGAKKVIILGSEGVVSGKVVSELEYIGVTVERIGGKNRYETAAMIASKMDAPKTAIIAYGRNFPDALAVAPYAAKQGYPILLVEKDEIPAPTKEYLENIDNTIIVGGSAMISEKVKSELPNPKRISGVDRFQTNAKLIQELQMDAYSSYITTGYNFADALTGSVLAAKTNSAILLVRAEEVPAPIKYILSQKKFARTMPLGGTAVVSDGVVEEIEGLITNDTYANAVPIEINKTYSSHLLTTSDSDYFKFKLDQAGNVSFTMDRQDDTDWVISVHTLDGEQVGYSEVKAGSEVHTADFGLSAGEYYMIFEDKTGTYYDHDDPREEYTFTVGFDSEKVYEEELNNSMANATQVDTDVPVHGQINLNTEDDVDFYQFSLNEPGKVEFEMSAGRYDNWYIKLYDENGTEIGYELIDSEESYTLDFGLDAGNYYVKVTDKTTAYTPDGDENEEYIFQLNYIKTDRFEKENNATFETASPIVLDGEKYTGAIQGLSESSDVDYYKFNISEPGKVSFSFGKDTDSDWLVYLYTEEGKEIGYYELDNGFGEYEFMNGLNAGTYYMKVVDEYSTYAFTDPYDEYTFSATYETSNSYEQEWNNSSSTATPIDLNKEYNGVVQGYSNSDIDADYYEMNLTGKGTLSLVIEAYWAVDLKYTIYDESLTEVTSDKTSRYSGKYSSDIELEKGKYYLVIEDTNDLYELNDSYETYTFNAGFELN